MAALIDLVPVPDAADIVLVPTFDLTDPDDVMAIEAIIAMPTNVADLGHAVAACELGEPTSPGTRRRRARAPRRRALGPPPPRLVRADGHATTNFERIQSDTRWGRCFCPAGVLCGRPFHAPAMQLLLALQMDFPNWHTRLELTPQQADLLDFPRVVYSQVRILW